MQKRKLIRIKEYDYSKEGMYFVTICTEKRNKILSKIKDNNRDISVGADDSVRPKFIPIVHIIGDYNKLF